MIKVLIVEDKTENIYLLQAMLDTNGFKTISARNGAEALGLLRTIIPDLIIADILMPVMDGFTLCRECKKDEILKNIPFFFYTATYTDEKDEEYALSLGADRFILKPQEPDVFLNIINDFMEEVKKKTIYPKEITQQPETIVLKEYNEVLIRKIEDKMLQSEKSEKELKKYAEELEREIDERKKNEKSLLKSEEYNRLLFTASPIGLALCTMDGSLIDVNPAFAKIIGRTIEDTLKLNYLDITPEKYATQEAGQIKNLEETGHYGKYEKEYIHSDGHLVPVLLQGLILERDGERFIWSSVEDITESKKAEVALQNSQQLFQTLAEVSPVGIFRTTPDGDTTYVNPKWSELSGLSLEEAIGKNWLNAVHPDDRGKVIENWKSNILSQKQSNAEYRFLKKDGQIVWVIGNAVCEWTNNEINGYIGTITDISAIKRFETDLLNAKEKAEESDKLKSAFLHNISHEVRTPMNAIIGFSDLIVDPSLSTEMRNEFIQTIVQSSNQLLSIITQIINIATIEAGQEKIYEKVFSLNLILKMLFDQFSPEAYKKNIIMKYCTAIPDGVDIIKTDETKLTQIISNLLSNALKFIKHGSIDYGYTVKDKDLEFYIRDTGIGIPEEMHEKIFERFRQVESTLAREYEGSGLGLSITKAYVELLGGRMWLTSTLGEGSIFYFTIPYTKIYIDKKSGNEMPDNLNEKLEKPVTILIAEDVDNNYMLLEQYLSNASINVIRAVNGKEAVEICETNHSIILVLMDLKMPVMDGFEASKRIKEFLPDLPIIAQTAYSTESDVEKAFAFGCNDFISKPYKKEELLTKIREQMVLNYRHN
jgi:PAS domain S-box-containing protein